MFVVVPLNLLIGKPPQTQCLEWFPLPPAWLQFLLLRHCCSPEIGSIILLFLHFRLPGPTARVSAAGSEAKTRGGSATANNRRSQSFNNYDKSKPVTSPLPPPPPSSHEKGKSISWGSFLASTFTADPVPLGEFGQDWEWGANRMVGMGHRTYLAGRNFVSRGINEVGEIPS